ncbi:Organic anion transporter 3 [Lemmus lemmus]
MTFSEILDRVGSMGPSQYLLVTLLALPVLGIANHNLLQIFTATTPAHYCRPPPNASVGPWVLPLGPNGKPEKCLRFVHLPNDSLPNDTQGATEPCLNGWIYNSTSDTIVTEWDLVCSSNKLKEMAQSIFMAGILVGGPVFGELSDRFGRKPILTWSYLMLAVSGSGAAFSPSLPVYIIFRFLCGCSISGISLSTVILNVEWVPTSVRAISSTSIGYFYTIGQFILSGLAYVIPQWRWLQLAVSVPFFIFSLLSWWVPESIRWLVLSGKLSKALKTLQRVATFNGKKEEGRKLTTEELKFSLQKDIASAKVKYGLSDLFRVSILRRVTFCLSLAWFATSFAYYGLVMDLQGFGVSIYLIQVIFGAVDLPAKFVCFLIINSLGRRPAQLASLLLAGICILVNGIIPKDQTIIRTSLAVLGKGCLASSFNCIFLYTGELYPTVIRQTGLGMGSTMARVGSIVSPLVSMTAEIYPSLPLFIFGAVPVAASAVIVLLPETLGQPLPDTVQDLKSRSKGKQGQLQQEEQKQMIPLQASTQEKNGL